jgi:transcriptional regulator with XRE-family HTH domain
MKKHRERLNLSLKEVAEKIQKSTQYIHVLESDDTKMPSLETLRDIIKLLGRVNCETPTIDPNYALEFASAALILSELERYVGFLSYFNNELKLQEELSPNSEVWIISDILGESLHLEMAKDTADNIINHTIRYVYFIPLNDRYHWKDAINNIKAEHSIDEAAKIDQNIEIYGVSSIAFLCRMSILNPLGKEPKGRYSIGGKSKEEIIFVESPADLTLHGIEQLSDIRSIGKGLKASEEYKDDYFGIITRRFP